MAKQWIKFRLNGEAVERYAEPGMRLLDFLREEMGLTGTKEGCGVGECGACTVLLDHQAVNACLVLLGQVAGREVTTIEGLAATGELSRLQEIFQEQTAIQCGFCTPGMILSAKALLLKQPHPSEAEIRTALAGNICRCSGYQQIVAAVQQAAAEGLGGGGRHESC